MHHINKSQERNHIISLDTEKAFDKVQRAFMLEVLETLRIDGTYFKIIKAICNKPIDNIMLNRNLLRTFLLKSGTRKGFSCSPFIASTETLAIAVRKEKDIKG